MNTNTNTRFATLRALSVLALAALTTLATGAAVAHADVTVDQLHTPSQQCGEPASATTLQFHVINSGSSAVDNNKISISLQTWADGPTSKVFTFSSSSFNLSAYEQEWITVFIPATAYGQKLKGQELKGEASLHGHSYYLDFGDNGGVNSWPKLNPAKLVITKVTNPSQQKNNAPFSITVTNQGQEASVAETLKVVMQPDADGPDGPSYTKTATVPVLQPGESVTVSFDAVDFDSDELEVEIYLNNVFEQEATFWG